MIWGCFTWSGSAVLYAQRIRLADFLNVLNGQVYPTIDSSLLWWHWQDSADSLWECFGELETSFSHMLAITESRH